MPRSSRFLYSRNGTKESQSQSEDRRWNTGPEKMGYWEMPLPGLSLFATTPPECWNTYNKTWDHARKHRNTWMVLGNSLNSDTIETKCHIWRISGKWWSISMHSPRMRQTVWITSFSESALPQGTRRTHEKVWRRPMRQLFQTIVLAEGNETKSTPWKSTETAQIQKERNNRTQHSQPEQKSWSKRRDKIELPAGEHVSLIVTQDRYYTSVQHKS
jgi:hypothetical protein